MSGDSEISQRAQALRRAFDDAFTLPPPPPPSATADILAIGVAGVLHAIRLEHISGLVARRTVVPVPSASPHLLGVAGVRGALVPVFSLASLLGLGAGAAAAAEWLVLSRGEPRVAFAFSSFDGYLRLPALTGDAALTPAGAAPVIDLPRLLADLDKEHHRP